MISLAALSTRERVMRGSLVASVALLSGTAGLAGQQCALPDSIRALMPEAPSLGQYSMAWQSVASLEGSLGVGHLHNSPEGAADLPPGGNDWLRQLEVPLSDAPGEEPWGWLVGGWIVGGEEAPAALQSGVLIETGYEESSMIVLQAGPDGWLRLRYSPSGDARTAWMPDCALRAVPGGPTFSRWAEWLLSKEISPLFFRSRVQPTLRSAPSSEGAPIADVSGDYILEPIEIRGEWMRVTLKQPSDYCSLDAEVRQTDGWVRWYSEREGPRVWYFTRGC